MRICTNSNPNPNPSPNPNPNCQPRSKPKSTTDRPIDRPTNRMRTSEKGSIGGETEFIATRRDRLHRVRAPPCVPAPPLPRTAHRHRPTRPPQNSRVSPRCPRSQSMRPHQPRPNLSSGATPSPSPSPSSLYAARGPSPSDVSAPEAVEEATCAPRPTAPSVRPPFLLQLQLPPRPVHSPTRSKTHRPQYRPPSSAPKHHSRPPDRPRPRATCRRPLLPPRSPPHFSRRSRSPPTRRSHPYLHLHPHQPLRRSAKSHSRACSRSPVHTRNTSPPAAPAGNTRRPPSRPARRLRPRRARAPARTPALVPARVRPALPALARPPPR